MRILYACRKSMPLHYHVFSSGNVSVLHLNDHFVSHHFYTTHWNLLDKVKMSHFDRHTLKKDLLYNIHLAPLWLLTNHISSHPSGEMRTVWDLLLSAVAPVTLRLWQNAAEKLSSEFNQREGVRTLSFFLRGSWYDSGAVIPSLTTWASMTIEKKVLVFCIIIFLSAVCMPVPFAINYHSMLQMQMVVALYV